MIGRSLPLAFVGAAAGTYSPPLATVRLDLRPDGGPVVLMAPGALEEEFRMQLGGAPKFPFIPFSADYVEKALATPTDWMEKGAVTPAKDQGSHGYCGTFGRVAAAEGQYALRSGHGLRNFSEEELIDCIGWRADQFTYWKSNGFMDSAVYPYNKTGGGNIDPPIPYNPCRYDAAKVIQDSANGKFTNNTGAAPNEEQLAAFIHHNGPVQTGINANVFGKRKVGCEAQGNCFITAAMCNDPSIKGKGIDHSITLTGYGTDPVNGDYWIVKNSWATTFANNGFIKVARGISCAQLDCCGTVFTYGDPRTYYEGSPPSPPAPSPPAPSPPAPSPPSPSPPSPSPVPSGWTPTYCQSCERTPALKDLGRNYAIADCIGACVNEAGCKFVNYAESSDHHCVLYAECKDPWKQSGCNPQTHDWWTTWTKAMIVV